MLATFAFDVCHDVYRAAREAIDSKIPTLNAENSGKYQWRPDRLPRLAEYVCDFARAGERTLGGCEAAPAHGQTGLDSCGFAPILGENRQVALGSSRSARGKFRARPSSACGGFRASHMVMFRVYYLGGAEYEAARRHLGISELTWADWADQIRRAVGRELARAGLFPPSKYFREESARAS